MPELPEVETIVQELNHSSFLNQTIDSVKIFFPKTIETPFKVEGQKFIKVLRLGKYLIFQLDKGYIIGHLRMTGRLVELPANSKRLPHEKFRLIFNKRAISFIDPRTFGRFGYYNQIKDALSHIGKDALNDPITPEDLLDHVKKSKRVIKAFLLDQSVMSGLGNIYVDETLWEAKINPEKVCQTLNLQECQRILKGIKKVLEGSIARKGTSLGGGKGNYQTFTGVQGEMQRHLQVYGQKTCSRCSSIIKKIRVAGRGTYFCPTCQRY